MLNNNMNEQFKDLKYKNEYQSREDLEETLLGILDTIKRGEVYATVTNVSSSGMSRRIKFYRIVQHEKHPPRI